MAFENCIAEIVAAGKGNIDENDARRILGRVFDRAARHERDGVSRADASLRAARELGDEERLAAAIEKRNAIINKMRRGALDERVVPGKEAQSVRGVLSGAEGNGRGLAQSIDAETHANYSRLIGGVLAELRSAGLIRAVLRRNKDLERDIAREMWRLDDPEAGQPTGNKIAEQIAGILSRYQEVARKMQNDAGAFIGKLAHYVTRQSHDMEKIRRDDFQSWRDFTEPKLDDRTFEGIDNRDTFLRNVWDALASGVHEKANGADWLGGFVGPGNLAKRVSQERKLHFKSADDWFDYNQRYGHGSVFDSVLHGLEHGGRNTALMRAFGTNPEAMYRSWIDDLRSAAKERNDFKTADALGRTWNDRILDTLTGASARPDSMSLARIGRGVRTMESLAKLGGVVLSSLPDLAVSAATLRWNGVPLLEAYTRLALAPLMGRRSGPVRGNREVREVADLIGVGIDGMIGRMLSRFHVEGHIGTGSKLLEWFHRANLLSYWTDSLKGGVGLMLSNNLARSAARDFADLPPRLQITLRRYGIEGSEWDAIRRAETRAADGRDYLLPAAMTDLPDDAIAHLGKNGTAAEMARIREDLRAKLGSYLIDQTREAMTEPRASDRTIAHLGTQAGTPVGEAARLIMQFKQYPITFLARSVGRELRRDGVDVAGVAHLIVGTTVLGYVAMTAKELAKGRNPRQPQTPSDYSKLVLAAMQQGGGLGIYGDFLFGEANRLGGGFIGTVAGPAAGTLEEAHKLFTALRGGDDPSAEALQFAKNNAPFVNLFYSRLALDYFVLHRLQEAANPGYLRRYERRVKKENAQTFWLRPTSNQY
jgi:hypothetical protein